MERHSLSAPNVMTNMNSLSDQLTPAETLDVKTVEVVEGRCTELN